MTSYVPPTCTWATMMTMTDIQKGIPGGTLTILEVDCEWPKVSKKYSKSTQKTEVTQKSTLKTKLTQKSTQKTEVTQKSTQKSKIQ